MGSGAFLVQACRYLAERLVEAWENAEKQHPGEVLITPEGTFSEGAPTERLIPADASERIAIARRVVADRCLYGVDINPMAVEMAKLSLWLITVDATGLSPSSTTPSSAAIPCWALLRWSNSKTSACGRVAESTGLSTIDLRRHIDEATKKRQMLEAMPSDTPEQIAAKTVVCRGGRSSGQPQRRGGCALVAVELKGLTGRTYEAERETSAESLVAYWSDGPSALHGYATGANWRGACFHRALAYPEIIGRGGFRCFIGNPPFLGGKRILNGELGIITKLPWGR